MRTATMMTLAAGAIALALALPAQRAQAFTSPAPSGLAAATEGASPVEQVRTVCRRFRTAYGWRTRCWWVGPRRYWGPRPYYRGYGWRHRHWRRW
jgi:hypothetical protein